MEFSHTYIMRELFDEDSVRHSVWNLNSNYYRMFPSSGFIEYEALDHSHTWRIPMIKNKFGFFVVEIKRAPFESYETGFQVL